MVEKLIFISSLIIPGSGHLFIKKYGKAFLGLLYILLVISAFIVIIIPAFQDTVVYHTTGEYANTYTIGTQEYVDHSFVILIEAIFSAFLIVAFALVNFGFARTSMMSYRKMKDEEEQLSLKEIMRSSGSDIIPHAITLPAYILMFIFIIVPAFTSIVIAFTNYQSPILPPGFLLEWNGLDNFRQLFVDPRYSGLFESTAVWTIVWTLSATLLTITIGIVLAIIANNPKLKGTKFFRTVFLLPWAVPAFLTILIFNIFFSKSGAMNTFVIPFFTGEEYSVATAYGFLLNETSAKITIILVQAWLGFPFVFVLVTGVLQAIPRDLYEASSIDGGNPWTDFWDITFPMILISISPLLVTQFTFNFNNVLIIYLMGGSVVKKVGAQYGPLETIASLGYRLTIEAKYSMAASVGLITSVVVSTIVLTSWIKSGAFSNEEVM